MPKSHVGLSIMASRRTTGRDFRSSGTAGPLGRRKCPLRPTVEGVVYELGCVEALPLVPLGPPGGKKPLLSLAQLFAGVSFSAESLYGPR